MRKVKISNPFEKTNRETEWSAASTLLSDWANQIIRDENLDIGPCKVEKIGVDGKRPDGLIYKNPRSKEVLAVIEFKPPPFDPFDENNLVGPATRKAKTRGVPFFATSNFQELIWFGTKEALNPILAEEEKMKGRYTLSTIADLDTLEEANIQRSIKKGLTEFLKDLYEVSAGKKHITRLPTDEFLIYRLQEKVKSLTPHYKEIIRQQVENDPKFRRELSKWFTGQNWNFTGQDDDYEKAARQTAYLLINKILFYIVLQFQHERELDRLEIPESLTKGSLLQSQLQAFFKEVLEIDYETIYSTDFIDEIAFPNNDAVTYQVKELVRVLNRYDFSKFGYDVLGRIFERLIPSKERHILGQYFTDPDIVDLILRFALKHEDDKIFDPGCGAGTFLVRAYQYKKLMNRMLTHEQIIPTLWGNDIAKFPAHLATINLAISDLSSSQNYPRIVQKDFFEWFPGETMIPKSSEKVFIKSLGKDEKGEIVPRYFDCIVGNPPYTRQEEITAVSEKDKEYKESLILRALNLNNDSGKRASLSKRAGLHAYFFVHGTKFLKNGGHFGFIVSNSWLDVDYGKGLQEHFLENYKIKAIIESKVERWFEQADVNTCIVLLEKASAAKDKKDRDENLVRFVYLKKPLHYFIPKLDSLWEKRLERQKAIDNLLDTIFAHDKFYENEDFRVFPKKQKELWEEGFDEEKQQYEGSTWGKYIRAPEIYFKILDRNKGKLRATIEVVGDIKTGAYTGLNDFYYFERNKDFLNVVERDFRIPLIRRTTQIKTPILDSNKIKTRAFVCRKSKDELVKLGRGALKYIKWGEKQRSRQRQKVQAGTPWPKIPSVIGRGPGWWSLPEKDSRPTQLFVGYVINDRFITAFSTNPITSDRCLHRIYGDKETLYKLNCVFLSTVTNLFVELQSTAGLGQGTLKFETRLLKKILVPNPNLLSIEKCRDFMDRLGKREVKSVFEEIGATSPQDVSLHKVKPDRRELDKIVMGEILGLTDEEQLEVYRAVVDLVGSRLKKAKSVEKAKKTKGGINLDLMIETVMKKIGTPTLGGFYKRRVLSKKNLKEIHLPEKSEPLEIKKTLWGYSLFSGKNFIECVSLEEAEYLKIFVEADWESVKIPEDLEIIKKVLPTLTKISQKVKNSLTYYTDGILDERIVKQIETLVWQEVSSNKL